MSVVVLVLGVLLAVVCVGSAVADFRGVPQVLETLSRLGIPAGKERVLGAIKLLAAIGLATGGFVRGLHVATGSALFLYFAIATVAHVRVRDGVRNAAPAFVLCALSVTFTLAAIAS